MIKSCVNQDFKEDNDAYHLVLTSNRYDLPSKIVMLPIQRVGYSGSTSSPGDSKRPAATASKAAGFSEYGSYLNKKWQNP